VSTTSIQPGRARYAFDNDRPQAVDQHACLSAVLDPVTVNHLSTVDLDGKRCLEV
jgi:hypothetical protein